jgi:hypothetical protein
VALFLPKEELATWEETDGETIIGLEIFEAE